MPLEIERKYLLKNDSWRTEASSSTNIKQGYLNSSKDRTVRVRVTSDSAWLTIKSKSVGATRSEFEYEIPVDEANELIHLCEQPIIDKTRNIVISNDQTWEIDEFYGENDGLIVAEIELSSEDETVLVTAWLGEEVTSDARYFNSSLISHPYRKW